MDSQVSFRLKTEVYFPTVTLLCSTSLVSASLSWLSRSGVFKDGGLVSLSDSAKLSLCVCSSLAAVVVCLLGVLWYLLVESKKNETNRLQDSRFLTVSDFSETNTQESLQEDIDPAVVKAFRELQESTLAAESNGQITFMSFEHSELPSSTGTMPEAKTNGTKILAGMTLPEASFWLQPDNVLFTMIVMTLICGLCSSLAAKTLIHAADVCLVMLMSCARLSAALNAPTFVKNVVMFSGTAVLAFVLVTALAPGPAVPWADSFPSIFVGCVAIVLGILIVLGRSHASRTLKSMQSVSEFSSRIYNTILETALSFYRNGSLQSPDQLVSLADYAALALQIDGLDNFLVNSSLSNWSGTVSSSQTTRPSSTLGKQEDEGRSSPKTKQCTDEELSFSQALSILFETLQNACAKRGGQFHLMTATGMSSSNTLVFLFPPSSTSRVSNSSLKYAINFLEGAFENLFQLSFVRETLKFSNIRAVIFPLAPSDIAGSIHGAPLLEQGCLVRSAILWPEHIHKKIEKLASMPENSVFLYGTTVKNLRLEDIVSSGFNESPTHFRDNKENGQPDHFNFSKLTYKRFVLVETKESNSVSEAISRFELAEPGRHSKGTDAEQQVYVASLASMVRNTMAAMNEESAMMIANRHKVSLEMGRFVAHDHCSKVSDDDSRLEVPAPTISSKVSQGDVELPSMSSDGEDQTSSIQQTGEEAMSVNSMAFDKSSFQQQLFASRRSSRAAHFTRFLFNNEVLLAKSGTNSSSLQKVCSEADLTNLTGKRRAFTLFNVCGETAKAFSSPVFVDGCSISARNKRQSVIFALSDVLDEIPGNELLAKLKAGKNGLNNNRGPETKGSNMSNMSAGKESYLNIPKKGEIDPSGKEVTRVRFANVGVKVPQWWLPPVGSHQTPAVNPGYAFGGELPALGEKISSDVLACVSRTSRMDSNMSSISSMSTSWADAINAFEFIPAVKTTWQSEFQSSDISRNWFLFAVLQTGLGMGSAYSMISLALCFTISFICVSKVSSDNQRILVIVTILSAVVACLTRLFLETLVQSALQVTKSESSSHSRRVSRKMRKISRRMAACVVSEQICLWLCVAIILPFAVDGNEGFRLSCAFLSMCAILHTLLVLLTVFPSYSRITRGACSVMLLVVGVMMCSLGPKDVPTMPILSLLLFPMTLLYKVSSDSTIKRSGFVSICASLGIEAETRIHLQSMLNALRPMRNASMECGQSITQPKLVVQMHCRCVSRDPEMVLPDSVSAAHQRGQVFLSQIESINSAKNTEDMSTGSTANTPWVLTFLDGSRMSAAKLVISKGSGAVSKLSCVHHFKAILEDAKSLVNMMHQTFTASKNKMFVVLSASQGALPMISGHSLPCAILLEQDREAAGKLTLYLSRLSNLGALSHAGNAVYVTPLFAKHAAFMIKSIGRRGAKLSENSIGPENILSPSSLHLPSRTSMSSDGSGLEYLSLQESLDVLQSAIHGVTFEVRRFPRVGGPRLRSGKRRVSDASIQSSHSGGDSTPDNQNSLQRASLSMEDGAAILVKEGSGNVRHSPRGSNKLNVGLKLALPVSHTSQAGLGADNEQEALLLSGESVVDAKESGPLQPATQFSSSASNSNAVYIRVVFDATL